jgi:uncharacterized protein (DUF2235 family)
MSWTWVVCIDGTWNQPGQTDKDPVTQTEVRTPSNVSKIWQALANQPLSGEFHYGVIAPIQPKIVHTGVQGEVIYLSGIGTTGTVKHKVLEGGTGTGTSERVRDAYRFLAERYEDGDKIYGFGFSRGAFAVRSLAGFIDFAGLPKQPRALKEEDLLALYAAYQAKQAVDKARFGNQDATINFIGVWDTVGALAFGESIGDFHRISPDNVTQVAHALALDEERERFEPSFWHSSAGATTKFDEVWFSGCHTNVGGGYADANLANIAYLWVLRMGREAGLPLDLRGLPEFDAKSVFGMQRDSYTEFYGQMGLIGKIAMDLKLKHGPRTVQPNHRIHQSVLDRMQEGGGEKQYSATALYQGNTITVDSNPGVEPWGGF